MESRFNLRDLHSYQNVVIINVLSLLDGGLFFVRYSSVSMSISANYRAIALVKTITKLFTQIVMN